jgi:hypothetical protein
MRKLAEVLGYIGPGLQNRRFDASFEQLCGGC